MTILETERLILRLASDDDAEFVLELLNDPSFVRNIGDKGVRTVADAREYISSRLVDSYERHGFGLYVVELKATGDPAGICGLVKRESLEDPDVGFAFLPRFWSRGYAFESAAAVMAYAREVLGLGRVVGVVNPDNDGSIRVLEKLGLRFERMVALSAGGDECRLYTPGRTA